MASPKSLIRGLPHLEHLYGQVPSSIKRVRRFFPVEMSNMCLSDRLKFGGHSGSTNVFESEKADDRSLFHKYPRRPNTHGRPQNDFRAEYGRRNENLRKRNWRGRDCMPNTIIHH
jgi:hypothetical protein